MNPARPPLRVLTEKLQPRAAGDGRASCMQAECMASSGVNGIWDAKPHQRSKRPFPADNDSPTETFFAEDVQPLKRSMQCTPSSLSVHSPVRLHKARASASQDLESIGSAGSSASDSTFRDLGCSVSPEEDAVSLACEEEFVDDVFNDGAGGSPQEMLTDNCNPASTSGQDGTLHASSPTLNVKLPTNDSREAGIFSDAEVRAGRASRSGRHDELLEKTALHPGIFDFDAEERPGDFDNQQSTSYLPGTANALLYRWRPAHQARCYMFDRYSIRLGTLYFKRLAADNASLLRRALQSPDFAALVRDVRLDTSAGVKPPLGMSILIHRPSAWLNVIFLTCVYLAAKAVHFVPTRHMLATILADVRNVPLADVKAADAEALELEVLQALDWRLGPYLSSHPTHPEVDTSSADVASLLAALKGSPPGPGILSV